MEVTFHRERERAYYALGLRHGVWGLLDQGGLFRLATVHAGRRRPQAARRAAELLRLHREDLNVAEVAVAALCRIVHDGLPPTERTIARLTGHRRPPALTPAAVAPIAEDLRAAAWQWAAVPVGATLTLAFDPS